MQILPENLFLKNEKKVVAVRMEWVNSIENTVRQFKMSKNSKVDRTKRRLFVIVQGALLSALEDKSFFGHKRMKASEICPNKSSQAEMVYPLTHSSPTAKQLFPGFFLHFSMLFFNFQDLNMIAMPNSHLVLHKETLKQYFEK